MDLRRAITKAYRIAEERSWEYIYTLVDAHDTICESNYKDAEAPFYPEAITALRTLGGFEELVLVLWTSCYPDQAPIYLARLEAVGVNIPYVNETPVENTKTGDFTKKPYFSVLIDDKAGFIPSEWPDVVNAFRRARSAYPLKKKNV